MIKLLQMSENYEILLNDITRNARKLTYDTENSLDLD